MAGGIEAIYDDMPRVVMSRFALTQPARGANFSSRHREKPVVTPVVSEGEYYPELPRDSVAN
jgi:hypothetical protein